VSHDAPSWIGSSISLPKQDVLTAHPAALYVITNSDHGIAVILRDHLHAHYALKTRKVYEIRATEMTAAEPSGFATGLLVIDANTEIQFRSNMRPTCYFPCWKQTHTRFAL
jgi:hypothetical protein